ncbi:dephospho-CoA kinase domain-containing protein [Homalodisca vitripennis]|uniref:dephospho-CoA kinase domain-containing protein n=2 Tax=Homalodisca vitripennis TaxID=197043 RepID=UPI001EEA5A49|nr:dephospho-CoA kinase domain-containing protein [Homalodisca vitripennis]
MFIVGLTGGIATGKTTVSEMFQEYGIPVIDADKMARQIVEPGRTAWKKIKKEFGDEVFYPSGELNRDILGEIIFDDVNKRRTLNEITHPEIYKEMFWAAVRCFFQGHQFVVMDLPLLFETGSMIEYLYKIIVVTCEEDIQLVRVIERGNLTETRAKKRIGAQMGLDLKCSKAHYVIENSGSIEDTRDQVTKVVAALKSSNHHWKLRLIAGLFCSGVVSLLIWLGTKFYQNRIMS